MKALAGELGLAVTEASRMTPEVMDELRAAKADLCVVAAYGCILPDELLEMFPLGCVNVHASLLPRWRGAAPIQRAVLEGDELAGASIMRVVHELDAAPTAPRSPRRLRARPPLSCSTSLGTLVPRPSSRPSAASRTARLSGPSRTSRS